MSTKRSHYEFVCSVGVVHLDECVLFFDVGCPGCPNSVMVEIDEARYAKLKSEGGLLDIVGCHSFVP